MKSISSWKRNGVQRRWLQSYAIMLLIPIILMTITYLQTRRVIEEEIHRANSALLSQLQQEIDNYMNYTYRLAEIISLNAKVASIMRNQRDLGWAERVFMVEALADFKSYNIAKRNVNHFYIYFHGGDFLLTDSAYYTTPMYDKFYLAPSGVLLDSWKSYLAQEHRGRFVSRRELTEGSGEGIMYVQSIAVHERGILPATLVIELNQEQLVSSIRNIQSYNEGNVYILDGSNKLLVSSESEGAKSRSFDIVQEQSGRMGTISTRWDGKEVVLSYIQSGQTNWKYVYVLPKHLYSQKAEYVRNMTFLMVTIAVIVGAVLAVLLAKRNYHPLQRLIRNVAERRKQELLPELPANEYDYLEEALDNALDRNNLMNRTIEKQQQMLRSNLLVRLLKGKLQHGFPLQEALLEYGIRLHTEDFAVLLFYLEDYSGFFRQDEQDEEKKRELVQWITTNIVEELVGQQHQGWMAEVDELLACIVNFRPNTSLETAAEDLKRLAEEAQRFIGTRFHMVFTVSISAIHKSAAKLPVAYQEALEAMEYRMLMGERTIIWHDRIKHQELSYSYPMEKEQQLINHVSAGDFPHACQTLNEIIDGNLGQENISVDMIRCLMFDMCSTMMKAAMEANLEHTELYEENREAIRELLNGSTVSAMRERMTLFLQKMCLHVEERRKNYKFRLKESAQAYIADHYRDHTLSVGTISEHFDVHPSYLSRYFKEQAGDNLTDYMNKYRIEQSKALLVREEILIRDISDRVGFYSISTFIRLFKKYEGITPSAYRDNSKYADQVRE